jgi:hypothetical protein
MTLITQDIRVIVDMLIKKLLHIKLKQLPDQETIHRTGKKSSPAIPQIQD